MDLRSPYALSITDLPRAEGSERVYEMQLGAPKDCGVELLTVPEGEPIELQLTLQSVSEGVLVQGVARTHAVGQCSRCLQELEVPMSETVAELVFYPQARQALADEGDEEAEEFPIIENDHIDLEPIIRDAIVLAMPFRPLCMPDCKGLCSGCGQRWDDLPDDHEHTVADPRFAALDALAAQLAQDESEAE